MDLAGVVKSVVHNPMPHNERPGVTMTVTYPTFTTSDQLMRYVETSGNHYFDRDTLQFFNARIDTQLVGGRFLVESVKRDDDPRCYRVLFVSEHANGRVMVEHVHLGQSKMPHYDLDGDTFHTRAEAREAARKATRLLTADAAELARLFGDTPITLDQLAGR